MNEQQIQNYKEYKNTKELNQDCSNNDNNLTSIKLTDKEAIIDGFKIPNSITNLSFSDEFDQPIKVGDIPDSVTKLTFGKQFNQLIIKGDLPQSITDISFGECFDQPLQKGALPPSVKLLNGMVVLTLS